MRIVKQGYPFILTALLLALVLFAAFGIRFAVVPLVLACYFAYFFRNPGRTSAVFPGRRDRNGCFRTV